MKLTKTKLKQLIKEELTTAMTESLWPGLPRYGEADAPYIPKAQKEKGVEGGEDTPEWVREMEDVMKDAHELYERMPEEGKRHFIENFEMYAKRWEEELEGGEEEYEEEDY